MEYGARIKNIYFLKQISFKEWKEATTAVMRAPEEISLVICAPEFATGPIRRSVNRGGARCRSWSSPQQVSHTPSLHPYGRVISAGNRATRGVSVRRSRWLLTRQRFTRSQWRLEDHTSNKRQTFAFPLFVPLFGGAICRAFHILSACSGIKSAD